MTLFRLLAGIAIAGSIGCTRAPELQDSFRASDLRLPFDQRLRIEIAAPIIVFGRVLEFADIGRPRRSPGDPRIKTQLTKLQIHVEEAIKGQVESNALEFYYFTYSSENDRDLGVPRYIPDVGQHRIYFLRRWHNMYRSVGDVTDFTLRLNSGLKPSGFCRGKEPGCCIAEMLLTPGRDMDAKIFAALLYPAADEARILCSPQVASSLVQRLITNPDPRIADSAREVLRMLSESDN